VKPKPRAAAAAKPRSAAPAKSRTAAPAKPKRRAAASAPPAKASRAATKPAPKPRAAKQPTPQALAAPPAKPRRKPVPAAAPTPTPAATRPRRAAPRAPKVAPDKLERLVEAARKCLEDDKAENIVVLDVSGRADYADRLIIATGFVDRQLQAMAAHLDDALAKEGLQLRRDNVQASPDWVLIDAGDLVIHLFLPEARDLYRLEKMWGPGSPEREELQATEPTNE